ncbi:hypothetical protein BDF21DRAFT_84351 [Thamnidium elegans]|nr:hypothetical protein BDF21DRAFT_84351 [Thamnidium elegans]
MAIDRLHHTSLNLRAINRSATANNLNIASQIDNTSDEPHIHFETKCYCGKGSVCNRLKAHLLVHLEDDIVQFTAGLHKESERGNSQISIYEAAILKERSRKKQNRKRVDLVFVYLPVVKFTRRISQDQIGTMSTIALYHEKNYLSVLAVYSVTI